MVTPALCCTAQMCPGMTRDDHSAQLVRAAEENNAALRSRGIPVLGELCIYQVRYTRHALMYI